MDQAVGALVIVDGGVAGLLAAAAAADRRSGIQTPGRDGVVLWLPRLDPETRVLRAEAVATQARLYGMRVVPGFSDHGPGPAGLSEDEGAAWTLLEAGFQARRLGAPTVVWPAGAGRDGPAGPDLVRVSGIVDRALLVSRLVSLDAAEPVDMRTPYADLADGQLAELALDVVLPVWACWWALEAAAGDPAAQVERAYWTRLFAAAGWTGELPGPPEPPEVVTKAAGEPAPRRAT